MLSRGSLSSSSSSSSPPSSRSFLSSLCPTLCSYVPHLTTAYHPISNTFVPDASSSPSSSSSPSPPRRPWVVWCNKSDACGLLCSSIAYLVIFYSCYPIIYYLIMPWQASSFSSFLSIVTFVSLAFLAAFSHARCMLTDPGSIPLNSTPLVPPPLDASNNPLPYPQCTSRHCNYSYKPPRAHHCSLCKRCIYRMDHHCPWVNNCVGFGNQKYFMLFCFYIACMAIFAFCMVLRRIFDCPYRNLAKCFDSAFYYDPLSFPSPQLAVASFTHLNSNAADSLVSLAGTLHMVFILIIALVFGLFCCAMLGSQLYAIGVDQTQIEQWQRSRKEWMERRRRRETQGEEKVKVPLARALGEGGKAKEQAEQTAIEMPLSALAGPLSEPSVPLFSATAQKVGASYAPSTVDCAGDALLDQSPSSFSSSSPPSSSSSASASASASSSSPSSLPVTFPNPLDSESDADTSSSLLRRNPRGPSPTPSSSHSSLSSSSSSSSPPSSLVSFWHNVRLVFLGDSSSVLHSTSNARSAPLSFLFALIKLFIPLPPQWADAHRLMGFTLVPDEDGAFAAPLQSINSSSLGGSDEESGESDGY